MTCWQKWVNENPEDAESKKELGKAEKKLAKEVAPCLAEGVQPEEIQVVKEEGDVNEEEPEEEAKEESPGSRDVVLVAEGVQRCRASEWLAGVTGGGLRAVRGVCDSPFNQDALDGP